MTAACARCAPVSGSQRGPAGAVADQSDCSFSTGMVYRLSIVLYRVAGSGPGAHCHRGPGSLCLSARLSRPALLCETRHRPRNGTPPSVATEAPAAHGVTDAICPPALRSIVVATPGGVLVGRPASAGRAHHHRAPAAAQS